MNASTKSLCGVIRRSDARHRIAVALGELLSSRPSRDAGLFWRFVHVPMVVWRWERVDSDGNVRECDRGFINYSECLADAVWRTFGEETLDAA